MLLDDFVQELVRLAEEIQLVSVLLYGSRAAGDQLGEQSDFNLLVLTRRLEMEELSRLSPLVRRWTQTGQRIPLFLSVDEFRASLDVFPVEVLDMQDSRRLLWGADPLDDLEVSRQHLRHQLEYELRSRLIQLREACLLAGGSQAALRELLVGSLSPMLVLLRGLLRFYQAAVPARKIQAAQRLARYLDFDPKIFQEVASLKQGEAPSRDCRLLFADYLGTLQKILRALDRASSAIPATQRERREGGQKGEGGRR